MYDGKSEYNIDDLGYLQFRTPPYAIIYIYIYIIIIIIIIIIIVQPDLIPFQQLAASSAFDLVLFFLAQQEAPAWRMHGLKPWPSHPPKKDPKAVFASRALLKGRNCQSKDVQRQAGDHIATDHVWDLSTDSWKIGTRISGWTRFVNFDVHPPKIWHDYDRFWTIQRRHQKSHEGIWKVLKLSIRWSIFCQEWTCPSQSTIQL